MRSRMLTQNFVTACSLTFMLSLRCFFFSSRTRHTSCLSDWSSDVCSSDLSGVFDAEQPFNPKVFTRLRAIARAATHTTIGVTLITDGGTTWNVDAIDVDGPAGSYWAGTTVPGHQGAYWAGTNVPDHPPAHWLHLGPLEIQTITPVERPRGLSVEIILSHGGQPVDATDIQLRDFEILFLPSGRKVRYLGEKVPM